MGKPKKERQAQEGPEPMPTIWRVSDELWGRVSPIIAELDPPKQTGRKRIDAREALDAIIFRMRSGCQWNHLPSDFPDDSSVHRTFQRWVEVEVFERMWAVLLEECDELGGWRGELGVAGSRRGDGQSPFWGDLIGRNPTDRGKNGVKRSLLVEESGGPLSIVVAGANRHDTKLLAATLDGIVVERPTPTEENPQHLCLDKGYDNPTGYEAVASHGYTAHIRKIGEEKKDETGEKRHPARRWVVERTLAWLSKCRAILIRYDKHSSNYLGLLKLACALLWFRRHQRLDLR
jgi:putative transposase